jgi:hypothetical protein
MAVATTAGDAGSNPPHQPIGLVSPTILPPPLVLHPGLTPSIPDSAPFAAPFYPLPLPNCGEHVSVPDYHDAVVEAIVHKVRDAYENMRFSLFKDICKTVGFPPRNFSARQIDEIDHMTLSDICKTGLRLILKGLSLEKYSYGLVSLPLPPSSCSWVCS